MEKITYSIICPIYNHKQEGLKVTSVCLDSVVKYSKDYELIVVDDASPIPVADRRADVFIGHKKNKGLSPSWNDGIKIARGDYLVLVNSDIEVCENWLKKMKDAFTDDVGVVAPAVEHLPNNPQQPPHQWFPGSCFMLKRETIEKVGLFDERFIPFYFEDTDFWVRILKAKLKMVRVFDVFIKHKESFTIKDLSSNEQYQKNYRKFLEKWGFDPIPIFCGGAPYDNFI